MKLHLPNLLSKDRHKGTLVAPKRGEGASVLILVLWISIGLVSHRALFREFHDL